MSAPVARTPRTPGGTVQGTRQQLDELDALLQRMLALPVNHSDGPPPASIVPEQEAPVEEEWIPPSRTPAPAPRLAEPAQPTFAPEQPTSRTLPRAPQRSYPASYMVVETATPPYFDPNEAGLEPRKIGHESREQPTPYSFSPPVPGGQHDLVEDTPDDPIAEAARAQLAMPDESAEWVPLQSSWQPSAQTWKPLAETWEQSRGAPPTRPNLPSPPMMPTPPRLVPEMPVWRENVIPPAPPGYEELQRSAFAPTPPVSPVAQESPPPPLPVAPTVSPQKTPLVLAPVVWFNKGFDLMLFPLGPLGRWLGGPAGRTILGNVGLLCLAGAIVLAVVEGFGWTR